MSQGYTPEELKACLRSIPFDTYFEPSIKESFPIGAWMHLGAQYIEMLEQELQVHRNYLRISLRPIQLPPKS